MEMHKKAIFPNVYTAVLTKALGLLNSGTNPGVFTDLNNSELKRTVSRVIR